MLEFFIALIFLLIIVPPCLSHQRQRKVSEQLKGVKDPAEAMAIVDGAIKKSKQESGALAWLRSSYFFWL